MAFQDPKKCTFTVGKIDKREKNQKDRRRGHDTSEWNE